MHLSIESIALLTSFDPADYLLCVHVTFAPESSYTEYNDCTTSVHCTTFFPFQDGEEV